MHITQTESGAGAALMARKVRVSETFDGAVVSEAKALELSQPKVSEKAIADRMRVVRMRQWKEENQAALQAWARIIEKEGLGSTACGNSDSPADAGRAGG
jgi:antitoxin CcdA